MMRIEITDHAYDRMKERLGLNKKAAMKIAAIAYSYGINHADTTGNLYRYISSQAAAYRHRGFCLRIYGEAVFCFVNQKGPASEDRCTTLVTVWELPQNLKKRALGLQRKRKKKD